MDIITSINNVMTILKTIIINQKEEDIHKAMNGDNGITILKDSDGLYKWISVYSNSFRDDDGIPEIISSKSHKDFVDNVDAGIYDYPDLLLWHVDEWKFGKATFVAYDEVEQGVVFAISGGTIDEGKEYVAEALLESGVKWQMSHSMPIGGIRRDIADNTVYAKHVSTEVSVLPGKYAANHLTGFGILEDNMIHSKKRAEIMGELGVSDEFLDKLEASNKDVATNEKETREFKEADVDSEKEDDTEDVVETSEDVTTETTDDASVETEEQVDDSPASDEFDIQALLLGTAKQFEEVFGRIVEVKEAITQIVTAIDVLNKSQKKLEKEFSDEKKAIEREVVAQTPAFSAMYSGIVKSIIGDPDVVLKKEETVDGPEETKPKANTGFGSFIDGFVEKSHVAQGDRNA